MKRKEQNRAAQRAFRERKEKHVRDVSRFLSISMMDFLTPLSVGGQGSGVGSEEAVDRAGERESSGSPPASTEREHDAQAGSVHFLRSSSQ